MYQLSVFLLNFNYNLKAIVAALTIQDILDWNRHYKMHKTSYGNYYTPSEESKMYAAFHYLTGYYFFRENCNIALQKLKEISSENAFLKTDAAKEWVCNYEWLGTKKLNSFLTDYNIYEEASVLEIKSLNIVVELSPFMPLVIFCKVFHTLHEALQLHLPAEERKPLNPNGYLSDTRVRNWLNKF